MESTWIPKCKHVFMHHRKFLPRDHQYRKKKKVFNGEVEDRVARRPLTGYEVYEQVKGVETLYGIKVLSGYSSNMKRFVTLNGDLKLGSMKNHDCHVMMQVFLPIALRGILP